MTSRLPIACLVALVAAAGCGGGGGSADPDSSGAGVFKSAGCGNCHTMKAANAAGRVGPDLDSLRPDSAHVAAQVTRGGNGMPAFGGSLSPAQIQAVADYVAAEAGKG